MNRLSRDPKWKFFFREDENLIKAISQAYVLWQQVNGSKNFIDFPIAPEGVII